MLPWPHLYLCLGSQGCCPLLGPLSSEKVKMLVTQLCLTLCNPMNYNPPGSSVHGILQARILEWVAISFSIMSHMCNALYVCICMKWTLLSWVWLFATSWMVAFQSPVSMDSPGQNTRVGGRSLLQGIFPTQGSNSGLPHCRQILYHVSHQGSPQYIYTCTHTYICVYLLFL